MEEWSLAEGVRSNSLGSARVDSMDGCFQHGLESLLFTTSSGQGPVTSGREGLEHKWAGVACRLQSNLSAGFKAGSHSFSNRQCDNSGGYSQAGIKEWDDSEDCPFVIQEGLGTQNHSEGFEDSRQTECGSRCPVSRSPNQIPAAGEGRSPSAGGYVCDATESQSSMFCSPIQPSGSSGDERFHSRLEQIYLFPLHKLLPAVIDSLMPFRYHGLIVVPRRVMAVWFPYLLSRATEIMLLGGSEQVFLGKIIKGQSVCCDA